MTETYIESFYKKNNLEVFITLNKFKKLKQIKLSKNQELYTKSTFFLVRGSLEVFYMDINGEFLKINTIDRKDLLVGVINTVNYMDLNLYYKTKEDSLLLEINQTEMKNLLTNVNFSQLLVSLLTSYFRTYITDTLINTKYPCEEKVKYFLKKEAYRDNIVYLENIGSFLDKYALNRTTYYRELKKLIQSGWLIKNGKRFYINDLNNNKSVNQNI